MLTGQFISIVPERLNKECVCVPGALHLVLPVSDYRISVCNGFQIIRLQLFEMISELFADTVVICHHEKLFTENPVRLLTKKIFFCRISYT